VNLAEFSAVNELFISLIGILNEITSFGAIVE
jgi:hypothetical protein